MNSKQLFAVLFTCIFCVSCGPERKKDGVLKLAETEVRKFLSCISKMPRDNKEAAFSYINGVLKYKLKIPPASPETLEAFKMYDVSVLDGESILMASSMNPHSPANEFGIGMMIYPPLPLADSNMILDIVKNTLGNYDSISEKGVVIWKINGWFLEVEKPNRISYNAHSTTSILDLFDKWE